MRTKIIELEEIDSTNEFCKKLPSDGDAIVIAKRQTGGKGTHGRSFCSDDGGLYLSMRKTYGNFKFENTFSIMINACVAVCRTVESFGLKPTVKWANDVLVGGRKICGTLIENTLGADSVCTSIVGIGLNVNNVLPKELREIATTMSEQTGGNISLSKVRSRLIANLGKSYTVEEYKSYINWFGQKIYLSGGGVQTEAVALDVDGDGTLVCEADGQIKRISSGEMSLRLKCKSI